MKKITSFFFLAYGCFALGYNQQQGLRFEELHDGAQCCIVAVSF
jgi:hypothetical protein